ncbi:hypothetical protein HMPREF9176_0358 [Streptococcus downei F0415]|uniref:hypothetical protein n=1 Tax=Streptococcus downei TaxID=1317 RepID=UPI0001E98F2D|nr:hypothetical protein [Streptococcus downei]EFQ57013.1 hypothetical protein HMPREF9176_0358 [Streptococcus downei F0415]
MKRIRVFSRQRFPIIVENAVCKAYENGERSVAFLLLFSVKNADMDNLLTEISQNSLVAQARWLFGSLVLTIYIKQ